MMKKRSGGHERSIRELRFGQQTIKVGAPVTDFQGILSGNPTSLAPINGRFPSND
jgi:circadian clock protein KaiC